MPDEQPLQTIEAATAAGSAQAGSSILARTARGAGWIVGWRMATRSLGLVSTLILARLLLPADFGLVALANAFYSSFSAISATGVDDALIRIKSPSRALYDTAFTMNMIRGLITGLLLVALGRPIAGFFAEPRLTNVLYALAVGAAVVGCHNIGTIDFRRDIAFDKEFKMFVFPRLISVIVTVTAALIFRSYWALVAGIMTARLGLTAYSYVLHPFRPRVTLSGWRELAGFSFWTWLLSLVALVRDRTDSFFVGRELNAAAVGVFAVATEIASLPTTEFVFPLGTATFAGFSAARHEGASTGDTYLRVIGVVAAVTVPAGMGIALLADPVVRLALGLNWLHAVPVIEISAIVGSSTVFGIISASLFSAHAYLSVMFKVSLGSMAVRVGLLAWLVPAYGIVGAAVATGTGMFLEYGIYLVLTCRRFRIGGRAFLSRIWRTLAATAVMAAALYAVGLGFVARPGPAWLQLAVLGGASALGFAIYVAALAVLWFAAGRPRGAESDLLTFGNGLCRKLPHSIRRRF